jgi:hypothetical protein
MNRILHVFLAALALLALSAPLAVAHDDDSPSGKRPDVDGRSAADITDVTATLRARIDPNDDDDWAGPVTYHFIYGTTTAYGLSTASVTFWGDDERTVAAAVGGLAPNTTYHYRAVASNWAGTDTSDDHQFKTLKAKVAAGGAVKGPKTVEQPELGRSVVAEAATGTVLVKAKGATEFVPIDQAASIPVDSTIDTTQGTVVLETAVAGGESQTGTFSGGQFKVSQSDSGKGMTRIALTGGDFSACGLQRKSRGGKLPRRQLWAKDKGGRFKTSGKGSVATVRGTSWYTADTCEGTLTKVKHGAVMVRERGTGRSKLVKRGQSFFGRAPH